jgi:hypothetical protein
MSEAQGLPPLPTCFHGIIANGDKVVNGFDQNIKINDGEKGKTDVFTPERLNDLGSKSSPFSRLNVAHNRLKDEMVGIQKEYDDSVIRRSPDLEEEFVQLIT